METRKRGRGENVILDTAVIKPITSKIIFVTNMVTNEFIRGGTSTSISIAHETDRGIEVVLGLANNFKKGFPKIVDNTLGFSCRFTRAMRGMKYNNCNSESGNGEINN